MSSKNLWEGKMDVFNLGSDMKAPKSGSQFSQVWCDYDIGGCEAGLKVKGEADEHVELIDE